MSSTQLPRPTVSPLATLSLYPVIKSLFRFVSPLYFGLVLFFPSEEILLKSKQNKMNFSQQKFVSKTPFIAHCKKKKNRIIKQSIKKEKTE